MPSTYLPVHGTWSAKPIDDAPSNVAWWEPRSPWCAFMARHEARHLADVYTRTPFEWSGDVDAWRGRHTDWHAGGHALLYYLDDVALPDRNLIAHSHGQQVALYAASMGVQIRVLITIGSPQRSDMRAVAERARPNIGFWLHVYDDGWDLWGQAGAALDGAWSLNRASRYADLNHKLPDISHSRVLYDPVHFARWIDCGWIDILTRGGA